MWILLALVTLTTQPEPIVLQGKTRFPTEAQCSAVVDEAKARLQKQVDSIGAVVEKVRCIKTDDQDI